MASRLALVLALVLLIRLPFLNQAIQGDDVYYLAAAQHAQIDPLHPNHVQYVFLGDRVDLRGHPHPPLNAWILALLLAVLGDIHEAAYHAVYIVFSLAAAWAMWSLARRFSPRPLWATLLFAATPAFVINGTSLEADVPFLAFWLASVALYVAGRPYAAACAMALTALAAYQAIFLTPILLVYARLHRRRDWPVTLAPLVVLAAWQVFERWSTGALPAGVLTGYFQSYGFQALEQKLRNAAALSVHALWLVFPALLPGAAWLAWRKRDRQAVFLASWIAIFFASALVVFFAGSARYLLPMAAPVALLASRLRARWLALGFAAHLCIGLALAWVNYEHWDGYRDFALALRPQTAGRRVWINGEWGLRYYLETDGGLALEKGQVLYPGDVVVTSELAYPVRFADPRVRLAETEIRSTLPLRLIGLGARSGYSTASQGFRPFDVDAGPIDRVRADLVVERRPTLEYLPMHAPQAADHIVSGLYGLENGAWRWTADAATVVLRSPAEFRRLEARFTIPDAAPARSVRLLVDGREVRAARYAAPGGYTLLSDPLRPAAATVTVSLVVDRTFSTPPDRRQLGVILSAIGFR